MLRIIPIPEQEAVGEIRELYESIRTTIGSDSVPLVFQYLASFPDYFRYLWEQAYPNLANPSFHSQAREIIQFGQAAISGVYVPTPMMDLLLERINNRPEQGQLEQTTRKLLTMNSSLYLLSLAVRESLKGKYLGIRQIGPTLSEEEKRTFYTVADTVTASDAVPAGAWSSPVPAAAALTARSSPTGLAVSLYQEFFRTIEREMEGLLKQESYLSRRVGLEQFALLKLSLLPYPLDSSFVSMTRKSGTHPQFPELVYLLADVFPTQMPYKLLASVVMRHALTQPAAGSTSKTNTRSTAVSLENVSD